MPNEIGCSSSGFALVLWCCGAVGFGVWTLLTIRSLCVGYRLRHIVVEGRHVVISFLNRRDTSSIDVDSLSFPSLTLPPSLFLFAETRHNVICILSDSWLWKRRFYVDSPGDLRAAAQMTCLVEAVLSSPRLQRPAPPRT